jgi:hypothetical protein
MACFRNILHGSIQGKAILCEAMASSCQNIKHSGMDPGGKRAPFRMLLSSSGMILRHVHVVDGTQSVAMGTGTLGRIEGKTVGGGFIIGDTRTVGHIS